MSGKGHAEVVVTFVDGKPTCTPDWVQLCWEQGPDNIKWKFRDIPQEVEFIEIEFLDKVPKKYKQDPGFLRRGPFRGMGFAKSGSGKGFADAATIGNTEEQGYFCYEVYFYNVDGVLVDKVDPGGNNDPVPPN